MAKTNGSDGKTTGVRKFTTTGLQVRVDPNGSVPTAASSRAVLRSELPALYQEGDFGLRFVGALEMLLDPVMGLLDSLPAHFTPDFAPLDILDLTGSWLGAEIDESWPEDRRREMVRSAGDLARRHGTLAGLAMTLKIAFPNHPLRVEDGGKITWSKDPDAVPEATPAQFVVYCDAPLDERELAAVSRLIDQVKPVNVTYRLRVKAAPKS